MNKSETLERLKAVAIYMNDGEFEVLYGRISVLFEQNADLRAKMNKNKEVTRIRELVEKANPGPPIEVAISAMREEELIEVILLWDTTEAQINEAYAALNRVDSQKYPDLLPQA